MPNPSPHDEDRGLPWKGAAAWGVGALLVGLAYLSLAHPSIAPQSDLWDYAQEARQITRGAGFTSLYTYPVHLDQSGPPFQVSWRMPLYAAIGAALLRGGVALPSGFLVIG